MTWRRLMLAIAIALAFAPRAIAQDESPPRIGLFVVDVRGTVPLFKTDAAIATSRDLMATELPHVGLGADAGLHVYPIKLKGITFGVGGQFTVARSHATPPAALALKSVTERFVALSGQLSLNFGAGDGWSYLSAGAGPSWWSIVPDGAAEQLADKDRLRTVNFGGGARWFAKPHLAFTFDVRFHQIDPGFPHGGLPGTPRTKFIIVGAGVSVK